MIPESEQWKYKMNLELCVCVCVCVCAPKERKYSKNNGGMSKRYRHELQGTFSGQIWNNLSIKIEIRLTDYNALTTIHVHEYILL